MDKIEEFLFDVLGLVIPGLLTLIMFVNLPMVIIDLNKINLNLLNSEHSLLSDFINYTIKNFKFKYLSSIYIITSILLISYIIGHIVKVFAKYQYQLFTKIFDQGINEFICAILKYVSNKLIFKLLNPSHIEKLKKEKVWYIGLVNILTGLLWFTGKFLRDIFYFSAPNYFSDNDTIKENVIEKINSKYNINFPKSWYSIYKISNVIMQQEKLKTLSTRFLAKYNFYRSMAFLFFVNLFYIVIFYNKYSSIISHLGYKLHNLIVILDLLLWITFHEKFKRYWTLCGNESLMSLFYFLNKPIKCNEDIKENKGDAKDE